MYKFETPNGTRLFRDITKAENYKEYCENQGWGLKTMYKDVLRGYYVWEYAES